MMAIEKKPGMDRLHRALVEAQRLTETGVEMMKHDGREIGRIAKSEFRDLAGHARLSVGRECVRLGTELVNLGQKLQGAGKKVAKPQRKARKAQ